MATLFWKGESIVQLGFKLFELTNGERFTTVEAAKARIDQRLAERRARQEEKSC